MRHIDTARDGGEAHPVHISEDFIQKTYLNRALAALTELEKIYTGEKIAQTPPKKTPAPDKRVRTIDLTNPTTSTDLNPPGQLRGEKIQPSTDDRSL